MDHHHCLDLEGHRTVERQGFGANILKRGGGAGRMNYRYLRNLPVDLPGDRVGKVNQVRPLPSRVHTLADLRVCHWQLMLFFFSSVLFCFTAGSSPLHSQVSWLA